MFEHEEFINPFGFNEFDYNYSRPLTKEQIELEKNRILMEQELGKPLTQKETSNQ